MQQHGVAGSGIGEEAYTVVTVSGSLYCTLLWVGAVDPIHFETGDVAPPAQHSARARARTDTPVNHTSIVDELDFHIPIRKLESHPS